MRTKEVFVVGAKGIPAQYGGFETFVDELVSRQQSKNIHYHVSCLNAPHDFLYHGARCFSIKVSNKTRARSVLYDIKTLREVINFARLHRTDADRILYMLGCRLGPLFKHYVKKLHRLGFKVYVNPDGHEWQRAKWIWPIKKYLKFSEKCMVLNADLVICDSAAIKKYIDTTYNKGRRLPRTTFIAYGADTAKSPLKDTDKKYTNFLKKHKLTAGNYYLVVGRFVPENNYETIIREFTKSDTKKPLVIITDVTENRFYKRLLAATNFDKDPRIKFVGTVYDRDLLKKLREKSFAYFHGHSVGGTNPSLLEALASTDLNLLYDCQFNREVARKGALYFGKQEGDLALIISAAENLTKSEIKSLTKLAKSRVKSAYYWPDIIKRYEHEFEK